MDAGSNHQTGSNHQNTQYNNQRTTREEPQWGRRWVWLQQWHGPFCHHLPWARIGDREQDSPHSNTMTTTQSDKTGPAGQVKKWTRSSCKAKHKIGSFFPGSGAGRWSPICPRAIQDCWCHHSSDIDWCPHLCYVFEVTLIEAYIILSVGKCSCKRSLNMILVCTVLYFIYFIWLCPLISFVGSFSAYSLW